MDETTDDTAGTTADDMAVRSTTEWLRAATSVTVLTGAGISTESGIPDFRGPQGVWTRDPGAAALSHIDTYLADPEVRRQAWRSRREHAAWTAQPNAAHTALVELERAGRLNAIITQNIDELHQRAGSAAESVIEVHGTIYQVECVMCGVRSSMREVLGRVDQGEEDPACLACGGTQKSATISFGQNLVPEVLGSAVRAARSCDVFLALGSSLTVHPVAGLCMEAVDRNARLVIINAEPTPYDGIADAVIRRPISSVLTEIVDSALAP